MVDCVVVTLIVLVSPRCLSLTPSKFAASTNLALNEIADSKCSSWMTYRLTDGDASGTNFDTYVFPCDDTGILKPITIILTKTVAPGFAVVYAGPDRKERAYLLSFFEIKLLDHGGEHPCGTWHKPFETDGVPMRVNCMTTKETITSLTLSISPFFRSLFAHSLRKKTEVAVSEIELWSPAYRYTIGFYGCFGDFMINHKFLPDKCMTLCYEAEGYFASFREEGECLCSKIMPVVALEDELCANECPYKPGFLCGTRLYHAVYVVNAPNLYNRGCFEVDQEIGEHDPDMTPGKCIAKCAEDQLKAGNAMLRNSTYCACMEKPVGISVDWEQCAPLCPDNDMYCGGPNTGVFFAGCHRGPYASSCVKVLKCKDGIFDHYGLCTNGCEGNYTEPHCLAREAPTPANTRATTWFETDADVIEEESTNSDVKSTDPPTKTFNLSIYDDLPSTNGRFPYPGQEALDFAFTDSHLAGVVIVVIFLLLLLLGAVKDQIMKLTKKTTADSDNRDEREGEGSEGEVIGRPTAFSLAQE